MNTTCTYHIPFLGAVVVMCIASQTLAAPHWGLQATSGPSPRYEAAMCYDSGRSVTVLFGGCASGACPNNETWEWNGSTWTQRFPSTSPSARRNVEHAMVYDSARGVTVLFGGSTTGTDPDNETWEWDGSTWTQRFPTTTPTARRSHSMAYDAGRGVIVMFGGYFDTQQDPAPNGETWESNGSDWTLRVVTGPSPRANHAMAYEQDRSVTVLFGGWTGGSNNGETWEWNGSTWTQRFPPSSPSPRVYHALAYDTRVGLSVLFGGWTGSYNAETWEWDGSTWTLHGGSGPSFRGLHAMAYDPGRDETVLFGGATSDGLNGETWSFGERAGAIPTLSEWGIIAMAALMLLAGGVVISQRRATGQ